MQIKNISLSSVALLAPMAGITQWPMRLIAREHGAGMVFSEMISAEGLVRGRGRSRSKTFQLLRSRPAERPLGIQIFGTEPATVALAARIVADLDADLIDINMGCPAPEVVHTGAGAALMKDPPRAAAMIQEVRKAINLPLTVKMRSGWDQKSVNALEIGRIAQAEGADALIIHARTRSQAFSGKADWNVIAEVAAALKIPVIGNGDIWNPDDAHRMIVETGCAGVMIGRGALGNPWIFTQINDPSALPPSLDERRAVIRQHYAWMEELLGPALAEVNMRKHIAWYVRSLPHATDLRRSINRSENYRRSLELVDEYFGKLEA